MTENRINVIVILQELYFFATRRNIFRGTISERIFPRNRRSTGDKAMIHALDYFREMNIAGVIVRLILALFCGGIVGLEREQKRGNYGIAGMRTYMLVCVGSALTIELSQYLTVMLAGEWSAVAGETGAKTDISRLGAQVVNGIGFLGAGTILVTSSQEVKGLTTAAALWASACMGLAIGAGFYECALIAIALIFVTVTVLRDLELKIVSSSRNMLLYIEYESMSDIGAIIECIKNTGASIRKIELEKRNPRRGTRHSAVISVYLARKEPHSALLGILAELDSIITIYEI